MKFVALLAEGINETTVPGSVTLPTWLLIAAIVGVFLAREWERKGWFAKIDAATDAINQMRVTMDKMLDRVAPPRGP